MTADGVYAYACETLSLGLLYFKYRDAIKEGDGERVMRVWKFLLLLFRTSGRTNYSIEALTLLTQYYLILPPSPDLLTCMDFQAVTSVVISTWSI